MISSHISLAKVLCVLLALIATIAYAEDFLLKPNLDILQNQGVIPGSDRYKPKSLSVKTPRVAGRPDIMAPSVRTYIGGLIFAEIAQPSDASLGECPALSYNVDEPNGKRLTARFSSGDPVSFDLFDWEIIPTLKYVDSGTEGVLSIHGDPEYISDTRLRSIYIHDDFKDTLLGYIFVGIDIVRKRNLFQYANSLDDYDVIGFNTKANGTSLPRRQVQFSNGLTDLQYWLGDMHLMYVDTPLNGGKAPEFWEQNRVFQTSIQTRYIRTETTNTNELGEKEGFIDTSVQDELDAALAIMKSADSRLFAPADRVASAASVLRYFMLEACATSEWRSMISPIVSSESIDGYSVQTPPFILSDW